MAMNLDLVGQTFPAIRRSWDSKDTILYALGLGAGSESPEDDLSFTTENSHGIDQAVIPTFPVSFAGGVPLQDLGDFDLSQLLHAEQAITLSRALPVDATVSIATKVEAITDKGSAALVDLVNTISSIDGAKLATTLTTLYVRGEGGFGDRKSAGEPWFVPGAEPDFIETKRTRPEQALLYRLSGDRAPLHSDPWFARRAGFDAPILHGLCTYGIAGRVVLKSLCENDPSRFGSFRARFAKPVLPGQAIEIRVWRNDDGAVFQASVDGAVVLDRGVFTYASSRPPT